jgi:hypothetical protein
MNPFLSYLLHDTHVHAVKHVRRRFLTGPLQESQISMLFRLDLGVLAPLLGLKLVKVSVCGHLDASQLGGILGWDRCGPKVAILQGKRGRQALAWIPFEQLLQQIQGCFGNETIVLVFTSAVWSIPIPKLGRFALSVAQFIRRGRDGFVQTA